MKLLNFVNNFLNFAFTSNDYKTTKTNTLKLVSIFILKNNKTV